ncbi:hypothetical protein BH23BAC2_BH23BAC2_27230 [soil metagenome]
MGLKERSFKEDPIPIIKSPQLNRFPIKFILRQSIPTKHVQYYYSTL